MLLSSPASRAAAELEVAKRELHDALALVDILRQELELRDARDDRDGQVETMREELVALAVGGVFNTRFALVHTQMKHF